MKNRTCDVVQDLLPLCIDGGCSEGSSQMVEDHLACCEECRQVWEEMRGEIPFGDSVKKPAPDAEGKADAECKADAEGKAKAACKTDAEGKADSEWKIDAEGETNAEEQSSRIMKTGMKKIRRRWIQSLAAVVLLVVIGTLGHNEMRGVGIGFTNLKEAAIAHSFMKDLKKRNLERAFARIDLEYYKKKWTESKGGFAPEKLADIEEEGRRQFTESAQAVMAGEGITSCKFRSIEKQCEGFYVRYWVAFDGGSGVLRLDVTEKGIRNIFSEDGSTIEEPEPLHELGMWSELLWQHYAGCYFDTETKEYVYK